MVASIVLSPSSARKKAKPTRPRSPSGVDRSTFASSSSSSSSPRQRPGREAEERQAGDDGDRPWSGGVAPSTAPMTDRHRVHEGGGDRDADQDRHRPCSGWRRPGPSAGSCRRARPRRSPRRRAGRGPPPDLCTNRPLQSIRAQIRSGRLLLRSPAVKVLLLVNSSASSVTARGRVMIQKALSADHEVTLAETSRRGHATRLAQGAAADGVDVVVVLGGDGTLNEAANGLAGTDTALAALPGGSTNVFARTLGLPDDAIEATVVLLEALAQRFDPTGRPRRGERSLLPLPRRHGLRRGHRRPGRAASRAQALRQPSALPVLGVRDVVPRLRPHPAPLRRAPPRTATSSTTSTSASASTRTPTPTSAPDR